MQKYKYLSYIFMALAILLSNVMCAAVAYNYCNMQWGIRYEGYSAPTNVAFLLVIPYAVGIVICVILACFFNKKQKNSI
ncbi:MAG: hypothetical protein K2K96_13035 [Lachnospiraceae bacterium]|nr:hypothetical protein [Lachnospiraceae bacterium]